jgi:anhydro-N-acetylmuramic acid kinase
MNPAERLVSVIQKKSRRLLGMMSGMSMDAVELALVKVRGDFPDLEVELEAASTQPYDKALRARLEAARCGTTTDICSLNVEVAQAFSNCIEDFLVRERIPATAIDAIGSHGQTVIHIPPMGGSLGSTLQLGCGQLIAQRTGIITVSNFRAADMAVGGHGAPLVPLLDFLLFRRPGTQTAVNNLGSISNVTLVTERAEDVLAFDTGPANMPIDYFARRVPGNAAGIDENGSWSARGQVIEPFLAELMAIPFLRAAPPKSAGYEEFGPRVLEAMATAFVDRSPLDLLRTAVEFSARSLRDAYVQWILPRAPQLRDVIMTGGGVLNATLMQRIAGLLPGLNVVSLAERDATLNRAKEAVAFATLAHLTLSGLPGNLPRVTGARRPVVLGEIALN